MNFVQSQEFSQLKSELDAKVEKYKNEILIAGFIENVNIRGRIIEYFVAGEDENLIDQLIKTLRENSGKIPRFKTKNELGDYFKTFDNFETATDVKTKILILNSNPKAYNIDKLLEFLARAKSIFMFYFIGIEPNRIVNKVLISMFQRDLLDSTIILKHWSGRNSRGVTQFEGATIHKLIDAPGDKINETQSIDYLNRLIEI